MEKIKFLCGILIVVTLFSSCAHSVYPFEQLSNNYNLRMNSEEDLSIKSKVNIYFNEKDIPGEYKIISVNSYKPFCLLPFQSILIKKMNKKFLSEAVKKAYEEGGNAILVKAAGHFYVLNLENWVADDMLSATFVNPIFDTSNMDIIKSGKVQGMKRGERIRTENKFIDEIKSNVDNIRDLNEIPIIREKITVLTNYNLTLKHPKSSIEKVVKKMVKKTNRAEKKIKKQLAKQAKKKASNTK